MGTKRALAWKQPSGCSLRKLPPGEGISVSKFVSRLDKDRDHANLSSTIRLYVLDHYRRLAEAKSGAKNKH